MLPAITPPKQKPTQQQQKKQRSSSQSQKKEHHEPKRSATAEPVFLQDELDEEHHRKSNQKQNPLKLLVRSHTSASCVGARSPPPESYSVVDSKETQRMVGAASKMKAKPAITDGFSAGAATLRSMILSRRNQEHRFLQRIYRFLKSGEDILDLSDGICADEQIVSTEDFALVLSILGIHPTLYCIDVSNGCSNEQGLALLRLATQNRQITRIICANTSITQGTMELLADQCIGNAERMVLIHKKRNRRAKKEARERQEAENVVLSKNLVGQEVRTRKQIETEELETFRKLMAVEHMAHVTVNRAIAFRHLREKHAVQREEFEEKQFTLRHQIMRKEMNSIKSLFLTSEEVLRSIILDCEDRAQTSLEIKREESWRNARLIEEERKRNKRQQRLDMARLETEARKIVLTQEVQFRSAILQSDTQLKEFAGKISQNRKIREDGESRRREAERTKSEKERIQRRERERTEELRRQTDRIRERDRVQVRCNQVIVACDRQENKEFTHMLKLYQAATPLAAARGKAATAEAKLASFCVQLKPDIGINGLKESYTYYDTVPRLQQYHLDFSAVMPTDSVNSIEDLVTEARSCRKDAVIALLEARRKIFVDAMDLSEACEEHQIDLRDLPEDCCPRAKDFVEKRKKIKKCLISAKVVDIREERLLLKQQRKQKRMAEIATALGKAPLTSGKKGGKKKHDKIVEEMALAAEKEEEEVDIACEPEIPPGVEQVLHFNLNKSESLHNWKQVEQGEDNKSPSSSLPSSPTTATGGAASPAAGNSSADLPPVTPIAQLFVESPQFAEDDDAQQQALELINAALNNVGYSAIVDSLDTGSFPHSFRSLVKFSVKITLAAVGADGLDPRGRLCSAEQFTATEDVETTYTLPIDVHAPFLQTTKEAPAAAKDHSSTAPAQRRKSSSVAAATAQHNTFDQSMFDTNALSHVSLVPPPRLQHCHGEPGSKGGAVPHPPQPVVPQGTPAFEYTGYTIEASLVDPKEGDTLALVVNTSPLQLRGESGLFLMGVPLTCTPENAPLIGPLFPSMVSQCESLKKCSTSKLSLRIEGAGIDTKTFFDLQKCFRFAVSTDKIAVCGPRKIEIMITDENGISCRAFTGLSVEPAPVSKRCNLTFATSLRLRPFFNLCGNDNNNLAALHLNKEDAWTHLIRSADFFKLGSDCASLDRDAVSYAPSKITVKMLGKNPIGCVTVHFDSITGLSKDRAGKVHYFGDADGVVISNTEISSKNVMTKTTSSVGTAYLTTVNKNGTETQLSTMENSENQEDTTNASNSKGTGEMDGSVKSASSQDVEIEEDCDQQELEDAEKNGIQMLEIAFKKGTRASLNTIKEFLEGIIFRAASTDTNCSLPCGTHEMSVSVSFEPLSDRRSSEKPLDDDTVTVEELQGNTTTTTTTTTSGEGEESTATSNCDEINIRLTLDICEPHVEVAMKDQRRVIKEASDVSQIGPIQLANCERFVDCFNGGFFRLAVVQGSGPEDLIVLRHGVKERSIKLELVDLHRRKRGGEAKGSGSVSTIRNRGSIVGGSNSQDMMEMSLTRSTTQLIASLAAQQHGGGASGVAGEDATLEDSKTIPLYGAGPPLVIPLKKKAPVKLAKIKESVLESMIAVGSDQLMSVMSNRRGSRFLKSEISTFTSKAASAGEVASWDDEDEDEVVRVCNEFRAPGEISVGERCRNAIRDHIRQSTVEYGALAKELRKASMMSNVTRTYIVRRASNNEIIGEAYMTRTDLHIDFVDLAPGKQPISKEDVLAILDASGYVCDPCAELTHSKKFIKLWMKGWDGSESQTVLVADIQKTENFPLLQTIFPRVTHEVGQYQTASIGSVPLFPYSQCITLDFAKEESFFDGGHLMLEILNPRPGDSLACLTKEEHLKMRSIYDIWRQEQSFLIQKGEPVDAHIEEMLSKFVPYDFGAEQTQQRNLIKTAPGGKARSKADEEKALLGFCYTESRTDMIRLAFHQHNPPRIDATSVNAALNSFTLKTAETTAPEVYGERIIEVRLKKAGDDAPESRIKLFVDVVPPKFTVGTNRGFSCKSVARVVGEPWPVLSHVAVNLPARQPAIRCGYLEARLVSPQSSDDIAKVAVIDREELSFQTICENSQPPKESSGSPLTRKQSAVATEPVETAVAQAFTGPVVQQVGPDFYVGEEYVGKGVRLSPHHIKIDFDWASKATSANLQILLSSLRYTCYTVPRERIGRTIEVLLSYGSAAPNTTIVTCAMTVEGEAHNAPTLA